MKTRFLKWLIVPVFLLAVAGMALAGNEEDFFRFFFGAPSVNMNQDLILTMNNGREFQVSATPEEIRNNIGFDKTFQLQMADGTYLINGVNIAYIRILR